MLSKRQRTWHCLLHSLGLIFLGYCISFSRQHSARAARRLLLCSVVLPIAKIAALLLLSTRGPQLSAHKRSWLFHAIEWSGRFSVLENFPMSGSLVTSFEYLRCKRSAASWMGVRGFLISWAIRRATSLCGCLTNGSSPRET